MSFDLAFWNAPQPASATEAQRIYVGLCEQEPGVVKPSANIAAFISAVAQQYPQIDDWPEADLDSCPWSIAFDQSAGGVIICVALPVEDDVFNFLVKQATRHELVIYDPQNDAYRLPV